MCVMRIRAMNIRGFFQEVAIIILLKATRFRFSLSEKVPRASLWQRRHLTYYYYRHHEKRTIVDYRI